MSSRAQLRLFSALLITTSALAQGLIVQRAGEQWQFSPAMTVFVNSKDRVLTLGDLPSTTTPFNKLGNSKLGGTLIADSASGVVAQYSAGTAPVYVYPQGLSKKEAPAPPDAWKESAITYRKSQQEKTPVPIPAGEFVAFLAGGVTELAELCMDGTALRLIGGPDGVFAAQLGLTAAAVTAFRTDPAMASVERRIADYMRVRQTRFNLGSESALSLTEGLRFAELSAKAYPDQPEHKAARNALAESKAWLDQHIAILRALAAGQQWDAFVIAYRDFEKHQGSFPELAKQHQQAMRASVDGHWKSGKERLGRGEYRRAWGELRVASARQPSNPELGQDVAVAWVEYSRQAAVDRQNKRRQLSPGEMAVIEQTRVIAERYLQQNKLDEAMTQIEQAERRDPESLPVLLTKAAILGARGETAKALRTLDAYDMMAVEREREAGNKLRSDLTFKLTESRGGMTQSLTTAWTAGRYHQTADLAARGLLADENYADTLYFAGVSALALDRHEAGLAHLRHYLKVSDTLDANPARRSEVLRLLGTMWAAPKPAAASQAGAPHWFSGRKLTANVMYCPVSLMFTPRIDRIAASNKLSVKFNWVGDQLRSIVPSFEKAEQATGEKTFTLSYAKQLPHVFAVDAGEEARKVPADPDALLAEANVLLPDNPLVDVSAVERLTGKRVTVGVAGNRFFHPFVWERPYYFAFEYDSEGRVKTARQLPDKEAPTRPPVLAEFEWNGLLLTGVKVYQLADAAANSGALAYQRTMQYQGDRLVSEEFAAGRKDGKIKYEWNNAGVLVSADCDKDEGLDNRSRNVFFATGPAAARGGR